MATQEPPACVMGDMDVVRPLGLAGVRCTVVAAPGAPVRYSRFTIGAIDLDAPSLVDAMVDDAGERGAEPVLYYESDRSLLFVSRNRDRLATRYRFLMPDSDLVDDLLDKARFRALAERLRLPVPRSHAVQPAAGSEPADLDLAYPVIVKPLPYRDDRWERIQDASVRRSEQRQALRALSAKVIRAEGPGALRELWKRLADAGLDFLVQEMIPGPENRIESYHVYVDEQARVLGEFTGRKIRTYPAEFGITTALETTRAPDVLELGRELIRRLDFRGVAKLDFKRAADGRLYLLEVNPRFSLWGHVGALAGVNLPLLAYDERVGRRPPAAGSARPGVSWCRPRRDVAAATGVGMSRRRWARWALACDSNSSIALDDPFPFLSTRLPTRLVRGPAAAAGRLTGR